MASTTKHSKQVDIFGDILTVSWDGNTWVSPCNGQQHGRAGDAMRCEIEAYFTSCGDDSEDEEIADQIRGFLSQMEDA